MRDLTYQKIREDFYEIIQRRKLKLNEVALAIYLRGKSCRYGNPFKLANSTICNELNCSEWIIRQIREKLQIKGVIKYNAGGEKGRNWTGYIMLDTVMLPNTRGKENYTPEVVKTTPLYNKNKEKKKKLKKYSLVHCTNNNRIITRRVYGLENNLNTYKQKEM